MMRTFKAVVVAASLALTGCSTLQPKGMERWAGHTEVGGASFYANQHEGRKTASGEPYSHGKKTAAHRKLPFGSRIRVSNLSNGKSVVVRVNDRGPFVRGRIVDLSRSAFSSIGNPSAGVIRVRIELID